MIVGDPSLFAIESSLTRRVDAPSQRGLGFFLIHVDGKSYGVRSSDATMLGCSFDEVRDRFAKRGMHNTAFSASESAIAIATSYFRACYEESEPHELFFGMTADDFSGLITNREVVWAPDGDEAFDDGSYVLQFDQGDIVRLIAFKSGQSQEDIVRTLAEASLSSERFYSILDVWQARFEAEWEAGAE